MRYGVYRHSYSELQAYRYELVDEEERVRCIAEPAGLFLPNPTRQVSLFDADYVPLGQLIPPPPSPWATGGVYTLLLEGEEKPLLLEERWNLVDRILLRLPRYRLYLDELTYTAHGHRYGEQLYEIFALPERDEPALYPEEWGEEREETEPSLMLMEEGDLRSALSSELLASLPVGELVGEILRAVRGPSYIIEVASSPLAQTVPLLTALVVLIDLHLQAYPL